MVSTLLLFIHKIYKTEKSHLTLFRIHSYLRLVVGGLFQLQGKQTIQEVVLFELI